MKKVVIASVAAAALIGGVSAAGAEALEGSRDYHDFGVYGPQYEQKPLQLTYEHGRYATAPFGYAPGIASPAPAPFADWDD